MAQFVPAGAPFAFEAATRALDERVRRLEGLDSKIAFLIAVDGVVAGLVFSGSSVAVRSPGLVSAGEAIFVLLSLFLGLAGFADRRYDAALDPRSVLRAAATPVAQLRWEATIEMMDTITFNTRPLVSKARLLFGALAALVASLCLVGGYFIYALAGGQR